MTKKEMRKLKKSSKVVGNTSSNDDVAKIIKIICAIAICFAIVYFTTAFITGEFGNKEEAEEVEIQKEEILMGETFEKKDSEYIIMYYDFEDEINANLYAMLIQSYNNAKKDIPMYKVDLSTNFSKQYMATEDESSNTKPTSLSNLKIKGSTLIRIKDKKVVKYVEGKDNIKAYINELVK